tara:strand:+ start:446 stop:745 length:300 start_codon:yes stop_codon:yes gene_type:complete
MAQFKKGNTASKGRPKGATNLRTRELQEKLHQVLDGQMVNILASFDKLAKQNPSLYLKSISDILPFVLPKVQQDTTIEQTSPITYSISFGGDDNEEIIE